MKSECQNTGFVGQLSLISTGCSGPPMGENAKISTYRGLCARMKSFGIILAVGYGLILLAGCTAQTETSLKYSDERLTLKTDTGRDIPLRLLTPEGCKTCALVIFSHGANSTNDRYNNLLLPMAQAGYRVAIPNHTDSEQHPNRTDYDAQDWTPTRLEDYATIASQYETNYLIAAGHSFGALIAQIAGGAQLPNMPNIDLPSPRAVLAYSPPGAVPNYIPATSWSSMTVPSLVTTGTTDIVPMMAETWEMHLSSYDQAPSELAYALIYQSMDHYMNGAYGRETDDKTMERQKAVKHLIESSLFFVSNLRNNNLPSAKQWETQEENFVEVRAHHE